MAVSAPPWLFTQLFDNDGELLALGKLYTKAGTASGAPLATYTDASGNTANTNPIIFDAAARFEMWLTENTAYAFVLKDHNGVTIKTIENVVVNPVTVRPPASADLYSECLDESPPTTHQQIFGFTFIRAHDFPLNMAGSGFDIDVAPTGSFAIDLRKNATSYSTGVSVGTLTIATDKSFVFSVAAFSVASGDTLKGYGPGSVDATAKGFFLTLLAYVTGSNPADFVTGDDVDAAIEAAIDAYGIGKCDLWPIDSLPTGWLTLTGADISRVTYAKLFNRWGTRYGVGNGTTTFGTPNPRGRFPRIWDPAHTIDTERAALEDLQADAFQGHFHQTILNTSPTDTGKLALEEQDSDATTTTISTGAPITDGSHGTPRTASETRPVNFAMVLAVYVGVTPA